MLLCRDREAEAGGGGSKVTQPGRTGVEQGHGTAFPGRAQSTFQMPHVSQKPIFATPPCDSLSAMPGSEVL